MPSGNELAPPGVVNSVMSEGPGVGLGLGDGLAVGRAVGDGLAVGVEVGAGLAVGVALDEGRGVGVTVDVGDGLGVTDELGRGDGLGVEDALGSGVAVGCADATGVTVCAAPPEPLQPEMRSDTPKSASRFRVQRIVESTATFSQSYDCANGRGRSPATLRCRRARQ